MAKKNTTTYKKTVEAKKTVLDIEPDKNIETTTNESLNDNVNEETMSISSENLMEMDESDDNMEVSEKIFGQNESLLSNSISFSDPNIYSISMWSRMDSEFNYLHDFSASGWIVELQFEEDLKYNFEASRKAPEKSETSAQLRFLLILILRYYYKPDKYL